MTDIESVIYLDINSGTYLQCLPFIKEEIGVTIYYTSLYYDKPDYYAHLPCL